MTAVPPEIEAARRILDRMVGEAQRGRVYGDGGADWAALRREAWRHYVWAPLGRGIRGLAGALAARRRRPRAMSRPPARVNQAP